MADEKPSPEAPRRVTTRRTPRFELVGDVEARRQGTRRIRWGKLPDGMTALDPRAAAERLGEASRKIRAQLARRIVGMDLVIEHLLIGLFSGGHCLLIGVPGLAKTLLVSSLAEVLALKFARIQFTPDLMPSDITGAEVLSEDRTTGRREYRFVSGPVFTHLLLADEINRTPPKTQAALLEAMEEGQVTSVGQKHPIEPPFFVLATQNPIEQEGTYPLPISQMDRFMFSILVDYPDESQEQKIVRLTISRPPAKLEPVLERESILQLVHAVRSLPLPEKTSRYAIALSRAARPSLAPARSEVREWVQWGPGPRATQHLILGAKARALLSGRMEVWPEDVRAVLPAAFRHRILMNYHAEVDGVTPETVIRHLLDRTGAPDRPAAAEANIPYVKSS